jgi:DNA-binding NarL/FixJ family response regulator
MASVEAYLQAGWAGRASELLELIAASSSTAENPLRLAELQEGRGMLAAQEGRHAEAVAHFDHAIERWHAMEAPYEEARAQLRRAESLLRQNEPSARAQGLRDLAVARATFQSLGAALNLAAVDTLLQRHQSPPVRRGGLTPRERQVIALIAQGLSNRQIAEALVISEKTAEVHVGNILGKLGFSSRAQAAAYAVEQGWADAPGVTMTL